jgi:hypothetical protein
MKQSTDIGFQGGKEGPKRHETILKTSQIHLTSPSPCERQDKNNHSPILINVVEILLGVFDLRHALKAGRSAPLSPYQTPKINCSTSKDEASVANAREKREQERTCTRAQRAKRKVLETKQGRRTEGKEVTRYLLTYLPTYFVGLLRSYLVGTYRPMFSSSK